MPDMSSPGVGSGLDVKAIVDVLVQSDISPAKQRLDRQQTSFVTELSALGQIKGALARLQTSMNKLSDLNQFYMLKSSISHPELFSASTSEEAIPGNYQVEVQQLATKQSLASGIFPSSTVGTGSITIAFGTYSSNNSVFTPNTAKQAVTINIGPGQNSLTAVRDAINSSGSGVQASIVQDSQGSRLTLTSPETGESYAMKISVTDTDGNSNDTNGLSALAYDPTTGINSLTQTGVAQDSKVKINGLLLTQSSNHLKNAITGITLDLKKAEPGTNVNLTIENNQAQLTSMVNEFIKQYNDTMTTLNNLTGYDAAKKAGGILQSDSGIRNLKVGLARLVTGIQGDANSPLRSLADIGIKTNAQGLLTLKDDVFKEALENNYTSIGALFAKTATSTDPGVKVSAVGGSIKAGVYDVVINSFTPGSVLTGTIGGIYATSTDGRTLTGTGNFKNLSIDILSGSTGNRGTIEIKDGLAAKIDNLLNEYLGDNGNLTSRTNQLNERLEDIGDKREQLQIRAMDIQRRYLKQFTALDVLLADMQSTSNFLTQQLANLPQLNSRKR